MKRPPRCLRAWLCLSMILIAAPVLTAEQLPAAEAWTALEKGDAARAASLFREAVDRSPRDPRLHFGAGWAAYTLGRLDAAIASLRKALEYDDHFVQAAALLAQVAYANSDLDLAIRSLERARALQPDDPDILRQLERWRSEASLHAGFDQRATLRFRILYEGGAQHSIGRRVEEVLESAYWSIGRALNIYPGETLTVILYTNQQFQDVTRAPAWAGGGYDGRIRIAVGGALRTPATLDRVVRHELVHAMIAHASPRHVPAWVHEGLAGFFESDDRGWARKILARATELYRLEDLVNGFGGLDAASASIAYAESAIAAEILNERLGPNLGLFLQMLGSGHSVDQALGTLNVPPDAFHGEWRRRVGAR